MSIARISLSAAVALCAATLLAETTVEGISVPGPGFTVCRYRPKTENGPGIDASGNAIQVTDIAAIQAYVDNGDYDAYATTLSPALAGYKAQFTGLLDYDGCAADDGYPGDGRWDRMDYQYFTVDGTISVPSSGKWTLCLGGRENSRLALKIWNDDGVALNKELTSMYGEDGVYDGQENHFFVCDLEAGEYSVAVRQFSPEAAVWYEVSAIKGDFYELTDRNDIWTWKNMALIVGTPLTSYDVAFDSDGGSAVAAQQVKSGKTADEPEPPLKAGFAFVCWTADTETKTPWDFSTEIDADLTLTAVWVPNNAPVVQSISSTPPAVEMSGSSCELSLQVVATDADDDELTYRWTLDGEEPAPYSFDDSASATPVATVNGPGTYVFKATVSDGHDSVSATVSVVVTVAQGATTFAFVGCDPTLDCIVPEKLLNPDKDEYPWAQDVWPNAQFKGAWRSTDTPRKQFLLDAKRENAYGLDGYIFPGACADGDGEPGEDGRLVSDGTRAEHVTSGIVEYDRDTYKFEVKNVTPYIASVDFVKARCFDYSSGTVCEIGNNPVYYCIDDPREEISAEVCDFQPSSMGVHVTEDQRDSFVPFATITFNSKVRKHPKIRVGILSGGRERFKPAYVGVGTATAPWGGSEDFNRNYTSASPDWMFFDIDNAKGGDTVTLSVKVTDNQWKQGQIHGIIFDSKEISSGLSVIVR